MPQRLISRRSLATACVLAVGLVVTACGGESGQLTGPTTTTVAAVPAPTAPVTTTPGVAPITTPPPAPAQTAEPAPKPAATPINCRDEYVNHWSGGPPAPANQDGWYTNVEAQRRCPRPAFDWQTYNWYLINSTDWPSGAEARRMFGRWPAGW